MRRRELITLVGGVALAWPPSVRAQQPSMPVIGFLHSQSPETFNHVATAFFDGLAEAGYVDGRNVTVEYRWAGGRTDRLPVLAADLADRQVDVIFSATAAAAMAAQAETSSIPIVFTSGGDPIALGLVAGLNRPGGNVTGVKMFSVLLEQKRLGLLRELVPSATTIAVLLNPTFTDFSSQQPSLMEAANILGVQLRVLTASTEQEIHAAFAALEQPRAEALFVGADPFFNNRREQIVDLAARIRVPAIYAFRDFVDVGGLMSYGNSLAAAYRQAGLYVGRILAGALPADLPVIQPTTFDLVLNSRTAASLGITVPPSILLQATEVIE